MQNNHLKILYDYFAYILTQKNWHLKIYEKNYNFNFCIIFKLNLFLLLFFVRLSPFGGLRAEFRTKASSISLYSSNIWIRVTAGCLSSDRPRLKPKSIELETTTFSSAQFLADYLDADFCNGASLVGSKDQS